VLEGRFDGGRLGLSLFLREGMAAWAEAWDRCVEVPGQRAGPRADRSIADAVVAEVVHVLAGMAMAAL
jgi:hypothetical protein